MLLSANPQRKRLAADLFASTGTFGATLLSMLILEYGVSVFRKDVLEIYEDVRDDFDAVISEEGENRLNALLLAVTTDGFYTSPDIFTAVASSLYDGDLGDLVSGVMEGISVPELLWAVFEVQMFYDENDAHEFSPQVQRIVESIVNSEARDNEGLELPEVVPYYATFLQESKGDLHTQLASIGVDEEGLDTLLS